MLISIVRTVVLYIFVTIAIRIMGKRQIGDMQPNELVITILISEIASMPIQDITQPVLLGVLAIFVLVALDIIMSVITIKSNTARKIINGHSAVIIKDGVLDQKLMKALRISVEDLVEVLRLQDVFDIDQVQYAILETNGAVSILLKPEYRTATASDVKAPTEDTGMPSLVIDEGIIINEGIGIAGASESKVKQILSTHRIDQSEVFLMTLDKSDNHIIIKKE